MLVSPAEEFSKYRFGEFEYGVFDSDLLRQRSERAGSDFSALYGEKLRGKLAVCRDARSIRLANIKPMIQSIEAKTTASLLYRVVDDYFGALSEAEQRHFLLDLDRRQAIYGAVGLGTISSDFLRRSAMFTFWITVFNTQQRNQGWVFPLQKYPIISTTNPKALADGHNEINVSLKLNEWGSKGLDDILQTYVEYLSTARNYEEDGRTEEALLHSVFALDLLLGGSTKDPLTSLLAERAAILTHLALNQEFDKVVQFVRDTYDMRTPTSTVECLGSSQMERKKRWVISFDVLKRSASPCLAPPALRGINRGATLRMRGRFG